MAEQPTLPLPSPAVAAPAPAPSPWTRPDDATRQAQLDAMKWRATALLAVAALVFAVARAFESAYPWLGYVRATAEASLVGGLADWFAVTALFRHPLLRQQLLKGLARAPQDVGDGPIPGQPHAARRAAERRGV